MRIGTDGTQTATYIAGISATPLGGTTQPVVVKSNGQLGTAPAAAAKASAAEPLSAADGRRMMAEIERLKARVQKARRLAGQRHGPSRREVALERDAVITAADRLASRPPRPAIA